MSSREDDVEFVSYKDESQMPMIMSLIEKDLSEPYSIFTYRYFINNWPQLCYLAMVGDECAGVIVCKLEDHMGSGLMRGYIAMLAVDSTRRKRGLGTTLVEIAVSEMERMGAGEAVLETEVTNSAALRLYENLGFIRDKRLHKYYLNGVDAFRLKLWFHNQGPAEDDDDRVTDIDGTPNYSL